MVVVVVMIIYLRIGFYLSEQNNCFWQSLCTNFDALGHYLEKNSLTENHLL